MNRAVTPQVGTGSLITDYHAKLYAHELRRRYSVSDSEKLAGALLGMRCFQATALMGNSA